MQAAARVRYAITYTILVILILIKRAVIHATIGSAFLLLDFATAAIPRPILDIFAVRLLPRPCQICAACCVIGHG